MTESWINFDKEKGDVDIVIFLSPDGLERVQLYQRTDRTFGRRNYLRRSKNGTWEVGKDWGHRYDTLSAALRIAVADFPWISEYQAD